MKNFFGITDDELFDKKFVKVIVGIAGSAKSSNIHLQISLREMQNKGTEEIILQLLEDFSILKKENSIHLKKMWNLNML